MTALEIWLLGIALAMDCFSVSIASGAIVRKMNWQNALTMAVFFGLFQAFMPLIGWSLTSNFQKYLEAYDHWIAFFLLLFLGIKMIRESFMEEEEKTMNPTKLKVIFALAVATSIDALAVGITFVAVPVKIIDGGSFINVVLAVIVIGVITMIISMAGVKIGNIFGSRYRAGSEIMGGTILIFIGLRSLITHLDSSNTLSDNETLFGMLIPLAGTLLGSAVIYAGKSRISDSVREILLGSSSGIMLSIAVWGMIEPAIGGLKRGGHSGILPVTGCFFLGVIIQLILDIAVPHTHVHSDLTEGPESRLAPEIKVMLKEVIHHIPEGIALGSIYAAHFMKTEWVSSSVALVLAVAIALQNIPEALYVSLPIRETGSKAGKAFFMGVVSGIPTPLLGMITVVVAVLFPGALPYIMAVAGGALIYTTIEEIPQIASRKDNDKGALAFVAGFAVIMMLIFL